MVSPLILATKEKQNFSLNTYKKTSHSALHCSVASVPIRKANFQFEYIQEDLAQRTPLFHCKRAHAEHTQDPK